MSAIPPSLILCIYWQPLKCLITPHSFHLQLSVIKLIFRTDTGNDSSEGMGTRECRGVFWGLETNIINMPNIRIACVSLQHQLRRITFAAIQTLLFAYPAMIFPPPSSNILLSKRRPLLFSTHPPPNCQIPQVSCMPSSILPQPDLWSHSFYEGASDINLAKSSESLLWEVLEKVSSLLKKRPKDKITS